MPTARRSRTIAAPEQQLWEVIRDPHHLPRWWPRVTRVEDVQDGEFTEVMKTSKGKLVRADFELVEREQATRSTQAIRAVRWEQRVEGTPFARLLKSAQTEVRLEPADWGGTEVTIEVSQTLNGFFPRFGGYMVRRAAGETIEEALDGLERISG